MLETTQLANLIEQLCESHAEKYTASDCFEERLRALIEKETSESTLVENVLKDVLGLNARLSILEHTVKKLRAGK